MRRRVLWGLLLLTLLSAVGCWDGRPIDQRAFVVMIGIDRPEDGPFRVTMQVQRAGFEQQRGEARGKNPAAQIVVSEGKTLRQAVENARDDMAREMDTTFLEVTVIGRAVAEQHMEELDWIVRTFRIPVSGYVAVAPDDAESVVKAAAPGYSMSAQFALFSLMNGAWTRSSAIVPGHMWLMFNRNWFTPLEDGFAPVLAEQGGKLGWQGLAVFRGHSLAGFLNETDAAMFNMLLGSRAERLLTADLPGKGNGKEGAKATIYLQSARVRRKVIWQGNRAVIQVSVGARGDLQELIGMESMGLKAENAVEAALSGALADEVKGLLRRLQEIGSDPVGFGELARQTAPYRKEVQTGEAWHEAYRQARLDVQASVRMIAPGYMK